MSIARSLAAASIGLLGAYAALPAAAQVSPLGPGGYHVPSSDMRLLIAAEAKLYDPAVEVGAVEKWANPATGDDGSVTLISTFELDGMPCRRLSHFIKLRRVKPDREFVISRCRAADGSWKIAP
jgi:surface antigen